MIFWLIIAVLCAASVYGLSFAFRGSKELMDPLETEKSLYRSRIQEIERDVHLGRLDPEAADAGKAEEARKLLRLEQELGSRLSSNSASRAIVLASLLFVPLFAVAFYLTNGNPTAATNGLNALVTQNNVPDQNGGDDASLDELISTAQRQLETNPDDVRGWRLLGPIYFRQGKLSEAKAAYDNLLRLNARDSNTLLVAGFIRMIENRGERSEEVDSLFAEASKADPTNDRAALLSSLAQEETDSLAVWKQIAATADDSEPWVVFLASRMVATLEPQPQLDPAAVRDMVAGLAARLEDEPADKEGWLRLVRAYRVLGEENLASKAYIKAKTRFEGDSEYLTELSDALAQEANPAFASDGS